MRDTEIIKIRYLQDGLRVQLGGIAANLARIASSCRDPADWEAVQSMLGESKFFIEWTAPEAPLRTKAFLAELQIQLAFWHLLWPRVYTDSQESDKLSQVTRVWSEKVLTLRE